MPGNGNKDINTVPRKYLSGEMYQMRELQLKVRLIFGYATPTSDMGDVPAMGTPNINLQFDDRMRFSDI